MCMVPLLLPPLPSRFRLGPSSQGLTGEQNPSAGLKTSFYVIKHLHEVRTVVTQFRFFVTGLSLSASHDSDSDQCADIEEENKDFTCHTLKRCKFSCGIDYSDCTVTVSVTGDLVSDWGTIEWMASISYPAL